MLMKCRYFFCQALLFSVAVILAACQTEEPEINCESSQNMSVICGLQAPEDLDWLPDRSGILISEYGHMGKDEGRISLYQPTTGNITELYSSKQPPVNITSRLWGDANCNEPDYFSPHGLHLSQRSSGRWQLLVVNHRSVDDDSSDSVEMFELKLLQDHWYLEWRGCVEAESNTLLNDVVAAPRGFFATRMATTRATMPAIIDNLFRRQSAAVLRWEVGSGWQNWKDIKGSMFNGIEWNRELGVLMVSEWSKNRVNFYDRNGHLLRNIELEKPDNISYDSEREKYYVTGQRGSLWSLARCVARQVEHCEIGFEVNEFDLRTLLADEEEAGRSIYLSEGDYFGAGTTAIVSDESLYVGSFNGRRLLRVRRDP